MSGEKILDLLSDDVIDYDYIQNNFRTYERYFAVKKINDEKTLITMALNDNYERVAYHAVEKIRNQNVLKEIALTHKNSYVRKNAIKKIRDDIFLLNIVKKDNNPQIRDYAVSSIHNQEMLDQIIKSRNFNNVATANAIRNITDEDKLIYFAQKYDYANLRLAAIQNPYLKDEETLMDFAKYDSSEKVRLEALKKLNSQEFFRDVAFHDSSRKVREYAASKLNSKNALRELIKNDHGLGIGRFEQISKMSRYRQMQLKDTK